MALRKKETWRAHLRQRQFVHSSVSKIWHMASLSFKPTDDVRMPAIFRDSSSSLISSLWPQSHAQCGHSREEMTSVYLFNKKKTFNLSFRKTIFFFILKCIKFDYYFLIHISFHPGRLLNTEVHVLARCHSVGSCHPTKATRPGQRSAVGGDGVNSDWIFKNALTHVWPSIPLLGQMNPRPHDGLHQLCVCVCVAHVDH